MSADFARLTGNPAKNAAAMPAHADPRVFQPTVIDEHGTPLTDSTTSIRPAPRPVDGLQHGLGSPRPRLVDAASPALREAMGNLLVIVRTLALFGLTAAATITVLIVLARLWGWLI